MIVLSAFCWLLFFICYFFIQSFSVFFDGVFSVFVDGDRNDSVIFNLLLRNMKIFQIGVSQGLLNSQPVFRVED